jgi:hypothetical protein
MNMTRFPLGILILAVAIGGGLPSTAGAQEEETPPPTRPQRRVNTQNLVSEREVFYYPRYERRNPFAPLLMGDEAGPRFEEIELMMIIFSEDPNRSVVLFGPKGGVAGLQGTAAREASKLSYRVRRGDRLGNVRILEIQRTRVVVEVEEFGLTEQRIMELRRPGEGGQS